MEKVMTQYKALDKQIQALSEDWYIYHTLGQSDKAMAREKQINILRKKKRDLGRRYAKLADEAFLGKRKFSLLPKRSLSERLKNVKPSKNFVDLTGQRKSK
jgi:hypothetical protein